MGLVRAKTTVYLGPEHGGHHLEGEEFDYYGPDNENLEGIESGPYYGYSIAELKNELTRRGIGVPPLATKHTLSELLVGDDSTPNRDVKPEVKPEPKKAKSQDQ